MACLYCSNHILWSLAAFCLLKSPTGRAAEGRRDRKCYCIKIKVQLNLGRRDTLIEENPKIIELSRLKCALENTYSYRFLIDPIDSY